MNSQVKEDSTSSAQELCRRLDNKGHRARLVPVRRLSSLRKKQDEWRESDMLDREFFEEHLKDFVYEHPKSFLGVQSIIVVASPQPHRRVSFTLKNTVFPVIIPAHYSYETDLEVAKILGDYGLSKDFRFTRASLPAKILAVCCGLAAYGKNNIAYVKGLGSYFRLSVFYSNLPADEDIWFDPEMLERCQKCTACLKSCPTQAICSDRFLLRAERCLTFHNERKQNFPSWLHPSCHNSLVGCLECQQNCPENKPLRNRVEDSFVFSREETAGIMNTVPRDRLAKGTVEKLKRLGMWEYYDILPRNITVLLARRTLNQDKVKS